MFLLYLVITGCEYAGSIVLIYLLHLGIVLLVCLSACSSAQTFCILYYIILKFWTWSSMPCNLFHGLFSGADPDQTYICVKFMDQVGSFLATHCPARRELPSSCLQDHVGQETAREIPITSGRLMVPLWEQSSPYCFWRVERTFEGMESQDERLHLYFDSFLLLLIFPIFLLFYFSEFSWKRCYVGWNSKETKTLVLLLIAILRSGSF